MSQILLDTIIDTINLQEQKINSQHTILEEIKEMVQNLPEYKESVIRLNHQVDELIGTLSKLTFPSEEIKLLSANLIANNKMRSKPTEIKHHHHVPKGVYIASCLFIFFLLSCTGWYHAEKTLNQYESNDIKYRYLKLSSDERIIHILKNTDSLSTIDPNIFRRKTINEEQRQYEKMKFLKEAAEKEEEVNTLKKKAKKR